MHIFSIMLSQIIVAKSSRRYITTYLYYIKGEEIKREKEDNDKNRLVLKFSMSRYILYYQVVSKMDNVLMMQLCDSEKRFMLFVRYECS